MNLEVIFETIWQKVLDKKVEVKISHKTDDDNALLSLVEMVDGAITFYAKSDEEIKKIAKDKMSYIKGKDVDNVDDVIANHVTGVEAEIYKTYVAYQNNKPVKVSNSQFFAEEIRSKFECSSPEGSSHQVNLKTMNSPITFDLSGKPRSIHNDWHLTPATLNNHYHTHYCRTDGQEFSSKDLECIFGKLNEYEKKTGVKILDNEKDMKKIIEEFKKQKSKK